MQKNLEQRIKQIINQEIKEVEEELSSCHNINISALRNNLPKLNPIQLEEYLKKRKQRRRAITLQPNNRTNNPGLSLKRILADIKGKLDKKPDFFEKWQLWTDAIRIMSAYFADPGYLSNIKEEVREIKISGKKLRLHIPYPQGTIMKSELAQHPFAKQKERRELLEILEQYVRDGAVTAFQLLQQVASLQKTSINKEEVIEGYPKAKAHILFNQIDIKSPADVVPDDVYVIPYNPDSSWLGIAYPAQLGSCAIDILSLVYDAIWSEKPGITAAHEFIHNKYEKEPRLFEVEHVTWLCNLFASSKDSFFMDLLLHPYSYLTDAVDIGRIYINEDVGKLVHQLMSQFGNLRIWNTKKIRNELIDEVYGIKEPLLELMKRAEVEYRSLKRYALDALVRLTGMETFPLWLVAAERRSCVVGTREERQYFKERYGPLIRGIAKWVKRIYFNIASSYMEELPWFVGLDMSIKRFFEYILEIIKPEFGDKEMDMAWDIFMDTFLKNNKHALEIDYGQVRNNQIKCSLESDARYLLYYLKRLGFQPHASKGRKRLLEQLACYDFLVERARLVDTIGKAMFKHYWDLEKKDLAMQALKFKPLSLHPAADVFSMARFPLIYKTKDGKCFFRDEERRESIAKKEEHTFKIKDYAAGKATNAKVIEYQDKNGKPLLLKVLKISRKKDKRPTAIFFGFENPNVLDTMMHSGPSGNIDRVVRLDAQLKYIPWNIIFVSEDDTYYEKGLKICKEFDSKRKKEDAPLLDLGPVKKVVYVKHLERDDYIVKVLREHGLEEYIAWLEGEEEKWSARPYLIIPERGPALVDLNMNGNHIEIKPAKLRIEEFVLAKPGEIEAGEPLEKRIILNKEIADALIKNAKSKPFCRKDYIFEIDEKGFASLYAPVKNIFTKEAIEPLPRFVLLEFEEGLYKVIYQARFKLVDGRIVKEEWSAVPYAIIDCEGSPYIRTRKRNYQLNFIAELNNVEESKEWQRARKLDFPHLDMARCLGITAEQQNGLPFMVYLYDDDKDGIIDTKVYYHITAPECLSESLENLYFEYGETPDSNFIVAKFQERHERRIPLDKIKVAQEPTAMLIDAGDDMKEYINLYGGGFDAIRFYS